jgi:hypothetical protein
MAWTMSVALRESCIEQDVRGDATSEPARWLRAAMECARRLVNGATEPRADDAAFAPTPSAAPAEVTRATASLPRSSAHATGSVPFPDPEKLAARISHDLRTPLNAVIGFSELMQQEAGRRNDVECRYRDYAAHIQRSGEALLKATEDTLVVTQMIAAAAQPARTGYGQPVPVSPIVERLVSQSRRVHLAPEAQTDLRRANPQVEGCETALQEAFARLANCFDQAAPEASHALRAEIVDDQLLISLETPATNRRRMTCHGDGYPLTADTLDLFIVQTMFALQGAEMSWVTDRSGRHLTARILFPLATQGCLPLEA